jgi:hypothetical protein
MSTLRVNAVVNNTGGNTTTVNGAQPINSSSNQIAKAWVNFNGTGTVAIRAQFNVSSITDNGAGNYTVNFATPMSDTNYSVNTTARRTNANDFNFGAMLRGTSSANTNYPLTTSSCDVICGTVTNATFADSDTYCVSVFR